MDEVIDDLNEYIRKYLKSSENPINAPFMGPIL